jgi:(R,R)-butanediol dehydrogenase/meso-butanediol dehydrogenase/diacetyl reductase
VREAVADIVAREREVGIDEISDGELGKVGFSNYVLQRMSGFAGVVLRITGAGICGTDATLFRLGPDVVPAGTPAAWPVVLGHEFAGEVVEVGAAVEGLKAGDLVACGAGVACGRCRACLAGRTNLCERYATAGVHRDGGLAEFCVVPAAICEPAAPYGVAGDAAALAQPMAVAEHAVGVASLTAGERALVLGAGGIGAFSVWAATSRGAEVSVCERDASRLGIARALGARETVAADPGRAPVDQLRAVGPFDVVYEMTGAQGPLDAAVALVRPGGRVVAVGINGARRPVDLDRVATQEIALLGSMAHVRAVDLPRALELIGRRTGGWADVAPTVLPLEGIVGDGELTFAPPLTPGETSPIKTLIDPSAREPRAYR